MVGKSVQFDSDVSGVVGSLFEKKTITLGDITKKIKNSVGSDDDVDNVSRLYLLLCLSVFYFPRTSRAVTNMPFKILDNLDNLSDYNWADSVHNFLIGGLNRACKVLRENQNSCSLHVAGCVAVVQLWVACRLGLEDVDGQVQFPRILQRPSVKIRTVNIESIFKKNKVVFDWTLSVEDKKNPIIQTALHIEEQRTAKNDGNEGGRHSKVKEDLLEKLEKNERLILEMKEQIMKMRVDFFSTAKPDPCAAQGNDFDEGEGCLSEQKGPIIELSNSSSEGTCVRDEEVENVSSPVEEARSVKDDNGVKIKNLFCDRDGVSDVERKYASSCIEEISSDLENRIGRLERVVAKLKAEKLGYKV